MIFAMYARMESSEVLRALRVHLLKTLVPFRLNRLEAFESWLGQRFDQMKIQRACAAYVVCGGMLAARNLYSMAIYIGFKCPKNVCCSATNLPASTISAHLESHTLTPFADGAYLFTYIERFYLQCLSGRW